MGEFRDCGVGELLDAPWVNYMIGDRCDTPKSIQQELDRRMALWQSLSGSNAPKRAPAQTLRRLGIYGGAQGIWLDQHRTAHLTDEGTGVTVGLLHAGKVYADDLTEDGILYHYPHTSRPSGRDSLEVEATKRAGELGLPVFVITRPSPYSASRDVYLSWVEDWDDEVGLFLITFGAEKPAGPAHWESDDEPFELTAKVSTTRQEVTARQGEHRFKFLVFHRYGPRCAVCGISSLEVLDAAHLRPKNKNGSDDPRNGLVLCATHHRAFDAGLFSIHPETLVVHTRPQGPDHEALRITCPDLSHLPKRPHVDALKWAWGTWRCRGDEGCQDLARPSQATQAL